MYYLSSGSNPKYNEFMGAYKLQWEMIKFSLDHHIDRYNFYGVTGDFSKDAEDYGVQQFKKDLMHTLKNISVISLSLLRKTGISFTNYSTESVN